MARTNLDTSKTVAPGNYPTAGVVLTETAADTSNKQSLTIGVRDVLIAHNTDTAAHTVTINSTADPQGRTGDITAESIAAGAIHVYGPFAASGWRQTDTFLHFEASDASVKFSILTVP